MEANQMKFSFQLKFDSLFEFSAPAYDDRHISYLLTEAQFRVFLTRYNPLANKYQKGFEADEQRRRDLEQLIRSMYIPQYTSPTSVKITASNPVKQIGISNTKGIFPGATISCPGLLPENTKITSIIKDGWTDDDWGIVSISEFPIDGPWVEQTADVQIIGKSTYQGGVHPNGLFLDLPEGFLYAVEEAVKLVGQSTESWVKPVRHDEYLANINNPYKKPYKNLIWRMDIAREFHSIGDVIASNKRTELVLPAESSLDYYRVRYLALPPSIVCNEFDPREQVHCILDETLHREIVDEAVAMAKAAVKPEEYQIGLSEKTRSE